MEDHPGTARNTGRCMFPFLLRVFMFVEVHAFGTLCFFILTRGRFAVIASFHAAILASAFFASQRPLTSDQKHPLTGPWSVSLKSRWWRAGSAHVGHLSPIVRITCSSYGLVVCLVNVGDHQQSCLGDHHYHTPWCSFGLDGNAIALSEIPPD